VHKSVKDCKTKKTTAQKAQRIISAWQNIRSSYYRQASGTLYAMPCRHSFFVLQSFEFVYFAQAYTPCRLTVGSFLKKMQKPYTHFYASFYIFFKNVCCCYSFRCATFSDERKKYHFNFLSTKTELDFL
jgi:hypothetical protein